ncbi:MAG: hypothetical protein AMS27_16850 [Bacteroides sp. SM23_62_1]|nr:MAG: hypothetical protein AMS27_16850 [Bacteroides sp. SM23_62_1]
MNDDPKVIEYINAAQSHQKEIMLTIRKMIFELVPDVGEAIKWGTPVYSRIKNICYMAAFKKHVTFAFYNGQMLKDPDGILEGTGKMMKHIKFKKIEDVDQEQIKKWILEGFYV